MPIRILTSNELGLVVVIFEGIVTAEEFDRDVAPLVQTSEFGLMPLALVDTTAAIRVDIPSELVRNYARRAEDYIDDKIEPGAKMALVATSSEFYGLGRMYQSSRGDSPVEIEVLRSREEAEAWLGLSDDYTDELSQIV
jgi:hypothetical protein